MLSKHKVVNTQKKKILKQHKEIQWPWSKKTMLKPRFAPQHHALGVQLGGGLSCHQSRFCPQAMHGPICLSISVVRRPGTFCPRPLWLPFLQNGYFTYLHSSWTFWSPSWFTRGWFMMIHSISNKQLTKETRTSKNKTYQRVLHYTTILDMKFSISGVLSKPSYGRATVFALASNLRELVFFPPQK